MRQVGKQRLDGGKVAARQPAATIPGALSAGSFPAALAPWAAGIALVLLVIASFGRIAVNDFTWFDDDLTLHHNPSFNPPTLDGILGFWLHPHKGLYVPVTYTAWGALALIAYAPPADPAAIALDPAVYHLASLAAHAATSLLVFAVLRRLFRSTLACFAGAALFAVHPVQVETVAWATSLKEGLCGLFTMAALWLYLKAAASGSFVGSALSDGTKISQATALRAGANPHRAGLYALALLCVALAQLSNPLAVVAATMAFVLDFVVLRRPLRTALLWSAPLTALAAGGATLARIVQPANTVAAQPIGLRLMVGADALAFYIWKLLVPIRLAVDYGRRPELLAPRGWIYWTWLVPVAAAALIVASRRRWVVAGGLLFAVGVAPVLGLIPFDLQRFSTPADRYLYLSMLGPALILAGVLAGHRSVAVRAVTGVWIALLSVAAAVQCGVWRDDLTLWRHAVAVAPDSYLANSNLGAAWDRLGPKNLPLAIEQYRLSISKNPEFFQAHDNMAMALARQGRWDEAIPEMQQTLRLQDRIKPPDLADQAEPRFALGRLLLARKRPAEAIAYLETALQLDPNLPGCREALAEARAEAKSR